jgi:hypothetical protein
MQMPTEYRIGDKRIAGHERSCRLQVPFDPPNKGRIGRSLHKKHGQGKWLFVFSAFQLPQPQKWDQAHCRETAQKIGDSRYMQRKVRSASLRREVPTMHALTIIRVVLLALILIAAVSLLPDFIRYMKIRSM